MDPAGRSWRERSAAVLRVVDVAGRARVVESEAAAEAAAASLDLRVGL